MLEKLSFVGWVKLRRKRYASVLALGTISQRFAVIGLREIRLGRVKGIVSIIAFL